MDSLPTTLRIGTRGSLLARWQAQHIADRLAQLGVATEVILIQTAGDLDQRSAFGQMPDKGVFVKELEEALLARAIDLAVHSLKDLPTRLPAGLMLAAVPERETPLDALVTNETGQTLATLPAGARIATGSLRRSAQVLALRPDLAIVPIRGNVPTRIEKIRSGQAEATLLAVAGLRRLGLEHEIAQVLPPEQMTPPMGQGALGIEARSDEFLELWSRLDHAPTRLATQAEREFLGRIGGGCRTPVGILVEPVEAESWKLTAMLAAADGRQILRRQVMTEPHESPVPYALQLANSMQAEAGPEIRAMLSHLEGPSASDPQEAP